MSLTFVWSLEPRSTHVLELSWAELTTTDSVPTSPASWTVAQIWPQLAAHVPAAHWQIMKDDLSCSIWGRKVGLDQVLRDGDRLEWTRPLRVDPKVARRERFVQQGMRTAGLFSKKRAANPPTAV